MKTKRRPQGKLGPHLHSVRQLYAHGETQKALAIRYGVSQSRISEAVNGKTFKIKPKIKCSAVLWHGPGHQSATNCEVTGKHSVHETTYGSFEQTARWRGKKAFTGMFDEPPVFKKGKR